MCDRDYSCDRKLYDCDQLYNYGKWNKCGFAGNTDIDNIVGNYVCISKAYEEKIVSNYVDYGISFGRDCGMWYITAYILHIS